VRGGAGTRGSNGQSGHQCDGGAGSRTGDGISPADFGKLIADETEKWAKAIRAANIKPE